MSGKPDGTQILWQDIDRDHALCSSTAMTEVIIHKYLKELSTSSVPDFDNLIAQEELEKHFKVPSLSEMALSVFSRSVRTDAEREKLKNFVNTAEVPNEARFRMDLSLMPNTKLDCLSLIRKYKQELDSHEVLIKNTDAFRKFEKIFDFLDKIVGTIINNNRVSEMSPDVLDISTILSKYLQDQSLSGIYFKDGVSGLGVLAKVVEKLNHFLSALSVCEREYWDNPPSSSLKK